MGEWTRRICIELDRGCLLYTSIPFSVKAAETSAAGVSIFSLDKKHPVAGAYEELTKEVLAHE